ncbi:hypothetical protein J1N35_008153 [Gossypium stocksii]|uniref:Uncharacterized protein n=1 Tax=Gossypium stocksii TaxID=47602 RepID=A0A9D3WAH5_9ROSI|nr:hypothetical protein J1N35_008153 [Gossypium stocksii]
MEEMQGALQSTSAKLIERNNALEAMVTGLNEEIEAIVMDLNTKIDELEGELVFCRVVVGKGMLGATPKRKVYVPKRKEFKGKRSVRDVDNFF